MGANHKRKGVVAVLSVGVLIGGLSGPMVAWADAGGTGRAKVETMLRERFTQADRNGDGLLQREEAREGMPRVFRNFDQIDTRQQGALTLAEIEQYLRQRMAREAVAPATAM